MWWKKRCGFALGLFATASSIGGTVIPIVSPVFAVVKALESSGGEEFDPESQICMGRPHRRIHSICRFHCSESHPEAKNIAS
ncbi:uncharacterized protein C8R40DRAFT_1178202 [Lentinula edodes]|uniref:uncharacterized protein n=1 Tax=Lentinula edodes TaxID=5353 RepID=UPI001E8CFA65|nr:uncharacterized protein C8R40DRAFT_1178202 [Lentinula edodes]KAH7868092.1 hypothetical protein C8R40DRAFT_1178202 [Lentinula edodes]